jgi:hypothetical protein
MCWSKIKAFFTGSSPGPFSIFHPEEPRDDSQTVANTDIDAIMTRWLTDWKVPAEHWDHWRHAIVIKLYDAWPPQMLTGLQLKPDIPAATWEDNGQRHLASLAKWFNPGVIAHEQAHNSYALMSWTEKCGFCIVYMILKNTHPLIKYLYSINPYGLTSNIEGHAEMYRYLGETMPSALKGYYPKLM